MEEEEKRESGRKSGRKKVVEVEYNVNNCETKERKEKEPNMVEQRKLINEKATSFEFRTKAVTLKNKEEFEEIVAEVNKVKEVPFVI